MTKCELPLNSVKDVIGTTYYLDEVIGQGGQGMVCRTKESNLAVKLLVVDDNVVTDPRVYDKYQEIINDVVILRIDDDIRLCKPEIMLEKPICGYVMKLLADLKPVSNLIYDQNSDTGFTDFFINTQGLKKRIEVLIELSRMLTRLHSKGLVYGDISHNNVFYSDIEQYSNVWLIDCDNIRFLNETKKGVYTPGYGAPEVVNDITGNTVFSDCFAFAGLVFRMLTQKSPFDVNSSSAESDGEDWDATTEIIKTEIDHHELSWIFENGLSDDQKEYFQHFIDKQLLDMFERTFGHEGRLVPTSRPSMQEWYEVLKTTLTKIRKCDCGAYILASVKTCPFCNRSISFLHYLQVYKVYSKRSILETIENIEDRIPFEEFKRPDDTSVIDKTDLQNNILEPKSNYPTLIFDGMRLYNLSLFDITILTTPFPVLEFKYVNSNLTITNKYKEDIIVYFQKEKEILCPGETRSLAVSSNEDAIITIRDTSSGTVTLVRIKGK